MMAAWRAVFVLASLLAASSATHGYGGYGHHGGDYDPRVGPDMSIVAHFETAGVRGDICFYQPEPGAPVEITVKLEGLGEQFFSQSFDWGISEYPVQFGAYPDFPCSDDALGNIYEPIACPENVSANCRYGDLGERLGQISYTGGKQMFMDGVLDLYGPNSPIGRSIVLRRTTSNTNPLTCANIEYQGISLHTLRAGFDGQLNGDVILRRQNGRSGVTLNVDLFTSCIGPNPGPGPLMWTLRHGTCDNIGAVVGTETHPDEIMMGAFDRCSRDNPRGCAIGDLTQKCGPVTSTETSPGMYRYRAFCNDDQLGLVPISTITDTVLVFSNGTDIVGCQSWDTVNQQCARVSCIKRPRVNIDILFFQNDPGDRTHVRSYVTGLDGDALFLQIRENAVTNQNCSQSGRVFDKPRGGGSPNIGTAVSDKPTGDALPVGTTQFKISDITGKTSLRYQDTTSWLPLFGPFSIVGKSIALVGVDGQEVTCCNIEAVADPDPALLASILAYQGQ